ncbi:MAG TPA: chitobiase/beta-hexosaminidase C-terminal domain-containing protein, partial [Prolixibacteraceae bacterium]|nr:chitobiase/beta-hexosaminidase C-terminal domain-containing protein [Prolixibacteraceae bacterium]
IKYLKGNADFKILMADRAQKHMLAAGGALTPAEAIRRYEDLAAEIDQAIIAESARWGDYRKDVAPSDAGRILYTRNEHWIPRKEDLLQNYFPYRTDIVLEQLRKNGLFPDIEAPLFSHESGEKTASFQLDLTAPLGEIYYTTDGTDPREPITSNVSASARTFSGSIPVSSNTTVKARARAGNEWSPLSEAKYTFEGGNAVWELAENRNFEHGNYPNPFSESTRLFYTLPADGYVEISIHRIDGRLVDRFVPGLQESGRHSVTWSPGALEAGVYIYRIRFDNQLGSGKLIRK